MSRVESQLQALRDCYSRVQTLRNLPQTLLTGPKQMVWLSGPQFAELKGIGETIKSEEVQEALRAAEASEKADGNVGIDVRRKQRRREYPESPKPEIESEGQKEAQEDRLKVAELEEYIRRFNMEHPSRLEVWRPTRNGGTEADATVLRMRIKDVLTAYVTAGTAEDGEMMVESIVCFGPRETGSPHGESSYEVYRAMSEWLAGQQVGIGGAAEKTKEANGFVDIKAAFKILRHEIFCTMLSVLEHHPAEGEVGVPLTVKLSLLHHNTDPIYLRLVFGSKPVATAVHKLQEPNLYQLDATAPVNDDRVVSLHVQVLNNQNLVLDSLAFGEFRYWFNSSPAGSPSRRHKRLSSIDTPRPPLDLPPGRRRAATTTATTRPPIPSASRIRANSLVRTKFSYSKSISEDLQAQTPVLQLITPLESICHNWDAEEIKAGRRLVRFTKVQDGCRLILTCSPVRQQDYVDTDSVISCIYREEAKACFVTSVDIIYLLERLTNDEFPVEEKNRIRRNLEGLRPTTVSKHKPGSEAFFQRIMEFPDPKPRNIEKDLKVFEWSLLGQALDKILSKYSVYTSSPTDSTISLPVDPPDDPNPVCHIATPDRDTFPQLTHTAPDSTKFEPAFDDEHFLLLSAHDNNSDALSVFQDRPASLPTSQPSSRGEPVTWQMDSPSHLGIGNYHSFQLNEVAPFAESDFSYHYGSILPSRDGSPHY
ncbi:hypothetical protein D9758_002072 [Tetrapyrgos nigripes]|uniref:DUF7082 domain-containing protein n=1 Tax=Tetrapyrgos nigripes TaxID=182062 RepID=A0A8H5GTB4_9AGAR|nr:hypothetical protein D9758_002072 [Tetrapyrgos nigripes]